MWSRVLTSFPCLFFCPPDVILFFFIMISYSEKKNFLSCGRNASRLSLWSHPAHFAHFFPRDESSFFFPLNWHISLFIYWSIYQLVGFLAAGISFIGRIWWPFSDFFFRPPLILRLGPQKSSSLFYRWKKRLGHWIFSGADSIKKITDEMASRRNRLCRLMSHRPASNAITTTWFFFTENTA